MLNLVMIVAGTVLSILIALESPISHVLILIIGLANVQGTLELAFGIPTIVPRVVFEAAIAVLFLKAIHSHLLFQKRRWLAPGLPAILLFLVACTVSYLLNNPPVLAMVLFVRHCLVFYILFLALINLNWSRETGFLVGKFIIAMALLQLPAAVEMYMRVGIREGWGVGTMSLSAGGLGTIFPLMAISFLMALFLYTGRIKYLLWFLPFIMFGVVNSKRALVFVVPVLLLTQLAVYRYVRGGFRLRVRSTGIQRQRMGFFRSAAIIVVVAISGAYIAGRALPSLNPSSAVGGTFDPAYIAMVILDYETMVTSTQEESGVQQEAGVELTFGRVASTLGTFSALYLEGPMAFLWGRGPGTLVGSSLTQTDQYQAYLEMGILAGKTGLVWVMNQVGIVGVLGVLWLYLHFFVYLVRLYRRLEPPTERVFALGLVGCTWVFLFDFLAYTNATLVTGAVTPVFYCLLAFAYKHLGRSQPGMQPGFPEGLPDQLIRASTSPRTSGLSPHVS